MYSSQAHQRGRVPAAACWQRAPAAGPRRARRTSGVLKIRKHGVCYLKLRIHVLKQDPSQSGGMETATGEQDIIPRCNTRGDA